MRACTLAFAISATITFAQAGYAQDRTFGDFDCTDDCSGHSAGYKWAERHSIEDEGNCPYGNSQSFHEGCIAYTRDPTRQRHAGALMARSVAWQSFGLPQGDGSRQRRRLIL